MSYGTEILYIIVEDGRNSTLSAIKASSKTTKFTNLKAMQQHSNKSLLSFAERTR